MTIRSLRAGVLAILLVSGAAPVEPANPADADAGGFHVLGRHLYDRCGEPVVLRGVNKMIIWTDIDVLQAEGPALIAADPDHNLVFSIHMWWPRLWGYTAQTVIDELAESAAMDLPPIIGEFGNQWDRSIFGGIPYLTILEQTHLQGVGMFPWEWGPGNNPQTWLDMTVDGTYDTLFGWGLEVAVSDEFSIANTAVRPDSMVTGRCVPMRVRAPSGRRAP